MKLYERVKAASLRLTGSKYGIHDAVGVKLPTFKGYFTAARENNLLPLLPKMLAAFPRLSRQWLYFDEGPMLIGEDVPPGEPVALSEIAKAVAKMAEDAGGNNAALLLQIAGLSGDWDAEFHAPGNQSSGNLAARVVELEAEIKKTKMSLEKQNKEYTRALEELLESQRTNLRLLEASQKAAPKTFATDQEEEADHLREPWGGYGTGKLQEPKGLYKPEK